jgi:hypothetical protein
LVGANSRLKDRRRERYRSRIMSCRGAVHAALGDAGQFLVRFAGDFVGFLDDSVDRRAGDRVGCDAMHLKDLLDALHVVLRFDKVRFERLPLSRPMLSARKRCGGWMCYRVNWLKHGKAHHLLTARPAERSNLRGRWLVEMLHPSDPL